MPELPEALTKKVGPLPVWAYIAVGGAGLAYASWRAKRSGGGSVPLDVSNLMGEPGLGLGGTGGGIGLAQGYNPTPGPQTPLIIPTNDVWVNEGVKVLVAAGYQGTVARELLFSYIDPDPSGYPLEKYQQITGAADRVIAAIGPPPHQSTVPRVNDSQPDQHLPDAPTDPGPASWNHVTTNYDTLVSLAEWYYGNGSDWGTIYVANKATIDALPGNGPGWGDNHSLREGMALTIPGRASASGATIKLRPIP